ncbi:MAG: AAA family ATPase [Candidatus Woesearchaeota archaeon]
MKKSNIKIQKKEIKKTKELRKKKIAEKNIKNAEKKQKVRPFVIAITGTPGTGKTTLAKKLYEKLSKKVKVKLMLQDELLEKTESVLYYDKKYDSNIVDVYIMRKNFSKYIKSKELANTDIILVDSHLSYELNPDLVIVTKCDLKELRMRLEKRGYNEEKIKDNLQAEIFDVCMQDSLAKNLESYYYWASRRKNQYFNALKFKEILSLIYKKLLH